MSVPRALLSLLLVALPGATGVAEVRAPAWPQWGGPGRDFVAPADGLAVTWPEEGPPRLWQRPLGLGHSAILAEDGRLYTMYRPSNTGPQQAEIVVCLDAASGETVWEHRYPAIYEGLPQYGAGPRSTPLITGDLLITVGVTGRLHALDKANGAVVWSHDLWGEPFGGNRLGHGYASSPLAFEDLVILPVGGAGAALVAFERRTGAVRWRSGSFRNSYSSPRLLDVAGEEQLVVFMADEVIGVAPRTGELRWSWPHGNQWGHNITMPVAAGDTLFLSSPQAGGRGLRLVAQGSGIGVEQVWSSRRIQLYHAATVQDGEWVYGSSGTVAPALMSAINIRTGEVAWRERGFAKANCVAADGKLVILDEDGVLYLAEATPRALVVHARTQLLDRYAWTVPTIVGRTLYARDQEQIVAVDLGQPA